MPSDDETLHRIDALEAAVRELQARVFPAPVPDVRTKCLICKGEGQYLHYMPETDFRSMLPCQYCRGTGIK